MKNQWYDFAAGIIWFFIIVIGGPIQLAIEAVQDWRRSRSSTTNHTGAPGANNERSNRE